MNARFNMPLELIINSRQRICKAEVVGSLKTFLQYLYVMLQKGCQFVSFDIQGVCILDLYLNKSLCFIFCVHMGVAEWLYGRSSENGESTSNFD